MFKTGKYVVDIWCLKYDKKKITEAECACPCAERRRPAVLGLGVGAGEPHALTHGGLDGGAQAEARQQQQQQHARGRGQHGTGAGALLHDYALSLHLQYYGRMD